MGTTVTASVTTTSDNITQSDFMGQEMNETPPKQTSNNQQNSINHQSPTLAVAAVICLAFACTVVPLLYYRVKSNRLSKSKHAKSSVELDTPCSKVTVESATF